MASTPHDDLLPLDGPFSPYVQEQIGWYVYLLRDPRNGEVFYVGKGKGNRVFQHAQDADTLPDTDKPKLSRIRVIHEDGRQVVTELVRHHIPTEQTAYLVEAAVIDAMRAVGLELTNAVSGHHSQLYGLASTWVAASIYDAPPLPEVDEPLVMFKIPKLWTPAMTEGDLYEATRGWWVLGPKARRAKYAVAVHRGVTRGVWRIEYWRERVPGDRDYTADDQPARTGFAGSPAPEMTHLLNRSVKSLRQGSGAVTIYLNCDDPSLPTSPLLAGAVAVRSAESERAPAQSRFVWQPQDIEIRDAQGTVVKPAGELFAPSTVRRDEANNPPTSTDAGRREDVAAMSSDGKTPPPTTADRPCARCGRPAQWLVTGGEHSAAPGRLLLYCNACRSEGAERLAVAIPLSVLDQDPQSLLLRLYRVGATRSDPDQVAEHLGLNPSGPWYTLARALRH
ncbi:hypothetical protein [Nostocoides sp. HKS02]|uniref:LEM-3-like GIY-YIG domain-containing protein n=1 Tax=Nostocoides sp. HKS02 TaxID=1813880 RepID=UPI0012B47268|nr:hypothetical protein [Tetrasphaera sp. HKS02]QGN59042.1 hypothetical protein GKE56_15415 [Tetrasphaera sp. HKS02]